MDTGGNIPPKYDNLSLPISIHRCIFAPVPEQTYCWHEDLEFKLIHKGSTIAVIDSKVVKADEDEILFINPYQIHSLPEIIENTRLYNLFMMHLDFFQIAGIQSFDLRKIFMEDRILIRNHIKNPQLTEILKKILNVDASDSPYKHQRLLGLIMEFFSIILEEERIENTGIEITSDKARYYYMIEPALKVIHSQYNQKIESDKLAQVCHMSLCYFCRIFRQVLGMTPTQYQTEYRMRIADMLLKTKEYSVSDIAHMVGYEDIAYFSRCFKKCTGLPPRQRRIRED